MRPIYRKPVNKSASARTFRNTTRRTKSANLVPPPMRGGYRF